MGRQSIADELKRKHNLEVTDTRRQKTFQGVISRAGDLLKSIGFTDELIINTVKARKQITYNDLYDLFAALPNRPDWTKNTFRVYVLKQVNTLVESGAIKVTKDIRGTSIFIPSENKEIVKNITKEKVTNPVKRKALCYDTPENLAKRAARFNITDDVLLRYIPNEGVTLPELLKVMYPKYKKQLSVSTFRKFLSGIATTSDKIVREVEFKNILKFYPAKRKVVDKTVISVIDTPIGFNVEEPQLKKLGFWGRLKYVLFGV